MEEMRQAALAGDVEKLDALLADDSTFINVSGGVFTKRQYVVGIRTGAVVVDALSFEAMAIRLCGNTNP